MVQDSVYTLSGRKVQVQKLEGFNDRVRILPMAFFVSITGTNLVGCTCATLSRAIVARIFHEPCQLQGQGGHHGDQVVFYLGSTACHG